MASEVESASIGLHRSYIVAPPLLLYRHLPAATVPNRSSSGTSQGYVGSPPWHTVAKPGSHRISTLDTAPAGFLLFNLVVLRWRDGSCRKSYGDAPE
jgi:hypothetical protein